MLYDAPEGASTPFIPPLPSPESAAVPPIVPTPNHQEPPQNWGQGPRTPAYFPYYPPTPYNNTPFIPPMPSVHATPAMRVDPPGSYYPAPTALPNTYGPQPPPPPPPPPPGFSADFTGYPTLNGTPWVPPPNIPPPAAMPPPQWPHPPTGYNAFQQPLPPGGPGWGPPIGGPYTPYTPAAAAWGPPPPPMPQGMTPNMNAYAGHTPWVHPTNPPPPQPPTGDPAGRWHIDQIDPFAEGPHYGPVLEPFLAKVVGASIRLNPLLAPPSDLQEDYLRWNMLFHTSNCYRTTESRRSWIKGRKAPATHPRLSHIRLVSRHFPWMIHVRARDPKIGVTCGEVLDCISAYLHGDVAKKEYESVSGHKKRNIWNAYQHNRSTDPNVPGGGLGESLKRLDWLCSESSFGGLVINSELVRELCGDVLPCTFELKCVPSYPLTPQELRDRQARQQQQQQHATRSSRASSRSRSSRSAPTSGGSEEEE